MISINEALLLIEKNVTPSRIGTKKLEEAGGFYLAQNIYSPIDMPLYRQSAMDGYAVKFKDIEEELFLKCTKIIAAGNTNKIELENKEAIRIFTGAKIPEGADTVVMQEKCKIENDCIYFEKSTIKFGENIRAIASQNNKGDLLLEKGSLLNAGALGFLASVGIENVEVFSCPKIAILVTGDELISANETLVEGKVYESNSIAIKESLKNIPTDKIAVFKAKDTENEILDTIHLALNDADILLITGGVSVGDYDFVHSSLEKIGVKKIFHKVKQKPGKPLYFGTKNDKLIFGLPGNPGSVLTCMIIYVLASIKLKMGAANFLPKKIKMKCLNAISKKTGLGVFYKAIINEHGAEILDHQESYKMNAFAKAEALILLDENTIEKSIGDEVDVYLI
ncbi:MAG: molybdopterin molybdotransferase MoeA [Chitinophagaceae bacterium]|nr:molybdopterin molybdotransferase MoeA [Chitinophagaceae bacterium]